MDGEECSASLATSVTDRRNSRIKTNVLEIHGWPDKEYKIDYYLATEEKMNWKIYEE